MKAKELTLKELLTISPTDSLVRFMQRRVLIFDALALGLLRKEIIETLGQRGARKILTRFGYAHGWRTAEMLHKEFPEVVAEGFGGEHLHRLFGLVNTIDIKISDGEGDIPIIESTIVNSYEAEQHLDLIGESETGVCWTLVGFASGYETYRTGREVYFIEDSCCASGSKTCHVVGRFKENWGDKLTPHLPYFEIADSNQILVKLTEDFQKLEERLNRKKQQLAFINGDIDPTPGFVVRSPSMLKLMDMARRVAKVDSSILVTGDSGVGKEYVSRYVHLCSKRKHKPFITVNCGALSETLLESELFGHVKGAFTGADRARAGLFEEAEGGTLFLDEIGETSLNMQVKLLRAIQEREVKRVGENISRPFDIRIIAATNRNLEEEVEAGRFRLDLLYRIKVIELDIPPLSNRGEDILPLANQFLYKFCEQMDRTITGLSRASVQKLLNYAWPGNVRELQNAMERAVALCQGEWIEPIDLPYEVSTASVAVKFKDQIQPMKDVERDYILSAIELCDNDKHKAAEALQIGIATLYRKVHEYNASVES
ncbi:sigma-54-dependent Fis family transcriptional regulator [Shewanella phaeophyticola]|uniref:Sigma-54-dependent Fis family transcriptional regulator n=1 Tax=Shewanella phaeophyticola TaxID=2978345 RepID=A0ABT2P4L2_9GAMM|nr:sigma-54-dependent Fis family transcriptional regulator [Shewanella sp. KJ10-1]MCT8987601.1 sigma-54-dependent Fis family transcriptional regulator [Shewanella sp. KJ10-1]